MKIDAVNYLKPQFIVDNFYTGDYVSPKCKGDCLDDPGWCCCDKYSREQQWDYVLDIVSMDDRLDLIFEEIEKNGFLVPVTARENRDGTVTFYDGHHRLSCALTLDIPVVPVYIGSMHRETEELVAWDSQTWRGGAPDSPLLELAAA